MSMVRRLLGFLLWSTCLLFPMGAVAGERHPNILLVIADDLGVGDVSAFTPGAARTPQLDALAARGMRFDRFYTDSTCSASRAALLTGQHPARLGFHPVARGISAEVVTLPDWLRQQGYRTHHVGKWHLGELQADAMPAAQGFDTSTGFLNQWFLQGPDADGQPVLRMPIYFDPWLQDTQGQWLHATGYLPDILTDAAISHIRAADTRPWFIWYATPLPHGPLHSPPDAGLADPADETAQYRAMVAHLDRNVGQLLQAIDDSGQADNTIVIVLGDNGAPEKRTGSNGPWGGGKSTYTEGGVRAPLLWVDPAEVPAGAIDQRATSLVDLFPTLAARIGAPLPFPVDGLNLQGFGQWVALRDRPLYWLSQGSYSMVSADKQWRLTEIWQFRDWQGMQLARIQPQAVEVVSYPAWLHPRRVAALRAGLLAWLEPLVRTEVKLAVDARGHGEASGNDFLRTPLKEWDWYMPVRLTAQPGSPVVMLAEQPGSWSLRYDAARGRLQVSFHGHSWEVAADLAGECHTIGLNADLYDRYTNLSQSTLPTEIRITLDGRELARETWVIDSLARVPVREPTRLGMASGDLPAWPGVLGRPQFFHRANVVGEWPFLLDEAALHAEGCQTLGE